MNSLFVANFGFIQLKSHLVHLSPNHWLFSYYQTNGLFIECGALDGENLSNTLYMERFYNWTGILIEADQDSFKNLLSRKRNTWSLPVNSGKRFKTLFSLRFLSLNGSSIDLVLVPCIVLFDTIYCSAVGYIYMADVQYKLRTPLEVNSLYGVSSCVLMQKLIPHQNLELSRQHQCVEYHLLSKSFEVLEGATQTLSRS